MSTLEDDIRVALRDEAGRLREVRPLLAPAGARGRRVPLTSPRRVRRLRVWLAPVTAVALVVVVALALVALRAVRSELAAPPPSPAAAPTSFPRYYVSLDQFNRDGNAASLVVGDSRTGARLTTMTAPAGASFDVRSPAGAAGNRMFVVAQTLGQRKPPYPPWATTGPTAWYLLRVVPGAAKPVTVSKLAIQSSAADLPVTGTALSPDGRYLAVTSGSTGGSPREDLRVYSVATGQRVHGWSMVNSGAFNYKTLGYLSWVNGGEAVAFTLTWGINTHQELRTLAVSAPGTELLAASRVVWSQYVPAPPGHVYTATTPELCGSPTLTPDGQTVTCWQSSYPAGHDTFGPVVLAYRVSSPAKPRVVARMPAVKPLTSSGISGQTPVYISDTEVIGYSFVLLQGDTGPVTIHEFLARGDTVRPLGTGTIATMSVTW